MSAHIWVHIYECTYMRTHIWLLWNTHICVIWYSYMCIISEQKYSYMSCHMSDTHICVMIYWYTYMTAHIWLHIYDCSYMTTNIWVHTYDYSYMTTHIWVHIYDYSYMITHIWVQTYDYSYMSVKIVICLSGLWWLIYEFSSKIICLYAYDHMLRYMIHRHMIICSYMILIYEYTDIWYSYMSPFPVEMLMCWQFLAVPTTLKLD